MAGKVRVTGKVKVSSMSYINMITLSQNQKARRGLQMIPIQLIEHTLNRKSLTCFVRTKPRGSVIITKKLALQRS